MKFQNETYIGNGLYASFNGHAIKIRAPRDIIYLEPEVWIRLLDFINNVKEPHLAPPQP